jgi:hypothetical protein
MKGYCSNCHAINDLVDAHSSGIIVDKGCCNVCKNLATPIECLLDYIFNHEIAKDFTMIADDGTIVPLSECNAFATSQWTSDDFDDLENSPSPIDTALDISDKYV